tara:strand:- start:91 stop:267 length:177 start_codon:yes stop_codon:yes gene_type:complete
LSISKPNNKPKTQTKNGIFTISTIYKTRTNYLSWEKDKFRDASKALATVENALFSTFT